MNQPIKKFVIKYKMFYIRHTRLFPPQCLIPNFPESTRTKIVFTFVTPFHYFLDDFLTEALHITGSVHIADFCNCISLKVILPWKGEFNLITKALYSANKK